MGFGKIDFGQVALKKTVPHSKKSTGTTQQPSQPQARPSLPHQANTTALLQQPPQQSHSANPLSRFKQMQLESKSLSAQQAKKCTPSKPAGAGGHKPDDILGKLLLWCQVNTEKYGLRVVNFTTVLA
jgi:hypothetical protein